MDTYMLYLVLIGWAAWAAVADLRTRRMPNTLTLGAVLVAASMLAMRQQSLLGGAPMSALLAMGLAIALTLPAYAMGKLGAADVKLLAAMGLLSDFPTLCSTFMVGAFVGGLMALWALNGRHAASLLALWSPKGGAWVQQRFVMDASGRHLPYGVALALGFMVSLCQGRL